MFSSLILCSALAAVATTAPTTDTTQVKPPKRKGFTVDFLVTVRNAALSYKAQAVAKNSNTNSVVLVSDLTRNSVGNPAFLTMNGTNAELNFDLSTSSSNTPHLHGVYSAYIPLVGDASEYPSGQAVDVLGVRGQRGFGWTYFHGEIGLQPQAPLNFFYSCDDVVNGNPVRVLKWGSPGANGTAPVTPVGCQQTRLLQDFDVPDGATNLRTVALAG